MPKSQLPFSDDYATVAERLTLFHDRHPHGRIITDLRSRDHGEVLFRARVYRDMADPKASATGWASERVGDGDVNTVACIENTETSAIGRALANLGFTASPNRPSLEEMQKAARERVRRVGESEVSYQAAPQRPARERTVRRSRIDELQERANAAKDALDLLAAAEAEGLGRDSVEATRARLSNRDVTMDQIQRIESRLRRWMRDRKKNPSENASPDGSATLEGPTPP